MKMALIAARFSAGLNGKTGIHKNSSFQRTVRNWKNLDESTISAKSIEKLNDLLS